MAPHPIIFISLWLVYNVGFLEDNSSARITQKTQLLSFVEVFTAPLRSNGRGADRIEKIVLLLSRACMLRALPSNGYIRHNILRFITY
jgi:hypothetical protein